MLAAAAANQPTGMLMVVAIASLLAHLFHHISDEGVKCFPTILSVFLLQWYVKYDTPINRLSWVLYLLLFLSSSSRFRVISVLSLALWSLWAMQISDTQAHALTSASGFF